MEFREYLKHLRDKFDFTLRDVEERTGISNAYLSQLESGLKNEPSIKILKKLAVLYNIDIFEMLVHAGYLDKEDLTEQNFQLPDCPYCEENDWRFLQFGLTTNYFQCNNCFHTSPPKKTKGEAIEIMMHLEKEREYHASND